MLDFSKDVLNEIFSQLKLKANVYECKKEGSFLICDVVLQPGGKVSRIERHAMEIAIAVRSLTEPLIYPMPSMGIIRIEFLMEIPGIIKFKEIFNLLDFKKLKHLLPLILGKTRHGDPLVVDLTAMPHLLISGATGSGKSMILQTILCSLISKNYGRNVQLALIDPKRVEFSYYNNIQSLWNPIACDIESSLSMLNALVEEMDRRFIILQKNKCRNILELNDKMPYIAVVIDELADLMMSEKNKVQNLICRLAQKSRACGIHLIVATQRPSVDVVTGVIKANFPARLSCRVSSAIDSRVILDRNGAEKLLGKGDAILYSSDYSFVRFKGAFLSENDILDFTQIYAPKKWWNKLWTNS